MIYLCKKKRRNWGCCSQKMKQSGTKKPSEAQELSPLLKGDINITASKNSMEKAVCNWIKHTLFQRAALLESIEPQMAVFPNVHLYLGYKSHTWALPLFFKSCSELLVGRKNNQEGWKLIKYSWTWGNKSFCEGSELTGGELLVSEEGQEETGKKAEETRQGQQGHAATGSCGSHLWVPRIRGAVVQGKSSALLPVLVTQGCLFPLGSTLPSPVLQPHPGLTHRSLTNQNYFWLNQLSYSFCPFLLFCYSFLLLFLSHISASVC